MTVNIYTYSNYREYLKDFYSLKKQEKDGFTYARFSEAAKLGSPNYFKLIADGEKNLTSANIIKFTAALKLSDLESDYFEALVNFNQAKDFMEKEYYQKRLERIKGMTSGNFSSQRNLEEAEFESISNWTYHAVMILTNLADFRESPKWIAAKLYGLVTEDEAASILDRLMTLGLLKYDENGKIVQSFQQLKTNPELKKIGARLFYEGMFKRAIESFRLNRPEERELGAYMVGISEDQLPEIRRRVREFLAEINTLALENPKPERVYSFMFAGIPLSSNEEVKGDRSWH
jgi:uncharacterized protein (TIGR02147 family)